MPMHHLQGIDAQLLQIISISSILFHSIIIIHSLTN